MDDLQTARDLRAAAEYLRTHGWIQHSLGTNGGPRCLEGALSSVTNFNQHSAILYGGVLGCAASFEEWCAGKPALFQWNDQPGRTAEEIIDHLDSTALALEVRALAASPEKNPASGVELVPVA